MRRRPLCLFAPAWLVAGGVLRAQTEGRVWRIGVLLHNIVFERFRLREVMADAGLEEGRNFQWVLRSSQGQAERLDVLAAELVAAKVDLIVAPINTEILAVQRATRTIPIVMLYATAPVETGLVASLSRPGGNLTGTCTNAPSMAGKMVEVMHDLLPRMTRLTYLYEPEYPGMALYQRASERSAAALGIAINGLAVRKPEDLDGALATLDRNRPDAVLVAMTGALLGGGFRRVIAFAAARRLPVIYSSSGPVGEGGLMSYAFDSKALLRRAATIIRKILDGAKPGEVPVEEPAEFELTINQRSAAAMGLTIPPAILVRAKEVVN